MANDYRSIIEAAESKYSLPPGSIEALEIPEVLKPGPEETPPKWYETILKGASVRNYEGNKNSAETAAQGGGIIEAVTDWDLSKMLTTGTFIVLGVVIIALAVLTNKTAQKIIVTGVTKGAA